MSKLYNTYLSLKKESESTIYLFKSGIFFIALDKDAETLSNIFKFKLTNFTPQVVKCGFPCSSFEKYSSLFQACNLNVKLIEPEQNTLYTLKSYSYPSNVSELLKSITSIDINSLSITEAYNLLEKIQNLAKEII